MAKKKKEKTDSKNKPDGSELVGGKSIFSLLSQTNPLSVVKHWLPTRLPLFDDFLSKGRGIPCGKVIEIYGDFASGKSAFCHLLMEVVNKSKGWVVFFDFEQSLDTDHLACYKINPNRFLYSTPDTIEQTFVGIFDFLEKSDDYTPFIIVIDSLAAVESEKEKKNEDVIAPIARIMSRNLRKLVTRLAGKNGFVVFTNQSRTKIGGIGYDKISRPGGKALDFYASAVIRTSVIQSLKATVNKKESVTGYVIRMETKKNRLAPPKRKIEFILSFEKGFNYSENLMKHLIDAQIASKRGGSIYIGDDKYSKNSLLKEIEEKPKKFIKLFTERS